MISNGELIIQMFNCSLFKCSTAPNAPIILLFKCSIAPNVPIVQLFPMFPMFPMFPYACSIKPHAISPIPTIMATAPNAPEARMAIIIPAPNTTNPMYIFLLK